MHDGDNNIFQNIPSTDHNCRAAKNSIDYFFEAEVGGGRRGNVGNVLCQNISFFNSSV